MSRYFIFVILVMTFHTNASPGEYPWPRAGEKIQTAIKAIRHLSKPSEMPRKIELLHFLLTKFTKESDPDFWGWIQTELGQSYYRNVQGDRTENVERAIEHYKLSLQVFTEEAYPKTWAIVHQSLATIYENRMKGDPGQNVDEVYRHKELAMRVIGKMSMYESQTRQARHEHLYFLEFKDDGACTSVMNITPHGNIDTGFIEADLKALGITPRTYFIIKLTEPTETQKLFKLYKHLEGFKLKEPGKEIKVFLGSNYRDVPRGEWVAFVTREGTVRIARNLESAAEALGCKVGDVVFMRAVVIATSGK